MLEVYFVVTNPINIISGIASLDLHSRGMWALLEHLRNPQDKNHLMENVVMKSP